MEIKVRGVDPAAVKKIDELAKTKGISRNEFLKIYLENLSVLNSLKNSQVRFEEALSTVGMLLKNQQKEMIGVQHELAEMRKIISHVAGIDEEELDEFYKEFGEGNHE